MSEVVGEAVVRITQDESGFDPAASGKKAGAGYASGFGGAIKGVGIAIAGVLATGKALDFLGDAVGEAREAQKVSAATEQIIKSTGSAANVTADQVSDLAGAISAKSGVDDEAIQSGQNLILTFKNVRNEAGKNNDVFNQATQAAVDLSAAGFGSIESASVMLGKALNDPIKGISALGRAGVTFSAAQKEQVKSLVESGDLLGAQKIILGEVKGQVGGVAEATATAGEKASVAWGNIKESIGTLVLPALDAVANVFVGTVAPAIEDVVAGAGKLAPVFDLIGGAVGSALAPAGKAVGDFAAGLGDAFDVLASGDGIITGFRDSLAGLGQGGDFLGPIEDAVAGIGPMLSDVASSIATSFLPVLQTMAQTFATDILPAVIAFVSYVAANLIPIVVQVGQIFASQIIPTIATIADYVWGTLIPAFMQIVTTVAENLKPVFDALVQVFQEQILPTFARVIEQIRSELIPALQPLIEKVVAVIGWLTNLASTVLGVVLPPLLRLAGFLIANIIPAIVSVITWVVKFVSGVVNLGVTIGQAIGRFAAFNAAIVGGVVSAVANVVSAIAGLPGKVLGFVGKMLSAGKDLIAALLRGMKNAATGVGGIVSDVAGAVFDAVKGAVNSVIDLFNSAIPNKIGVGPVSVDLPDNPIPHLQGGSRGVAGGWYDVGEVGPERVYLPAGARVLTAAQTRQDGAGGLGDIEALAAALAAALAPLLAGLRPVQFALPSGDPEAAAMAAINRLATV